MPSVGAMNNLLLQIQKACEVKRYHADLIAPQTVGNHSAFVALIIHHLWPKAPKQVIIAALMHDLSESHTGDMRAPAKWASPELAQLLADEEHRWMNEVGLLMPEIRGDYKLMLKIADHLELVYYCVLQYLQGNRHAIAPIKAVIPHIRKNCELLDDKRALHILDQLTREAGIY